MITRHRKYSTWVNIENQHKDADVSGSFVLLFPLMFVQGYKNLQTRHDNISCFYHTLLFCTTILQQLEYLYIYIYIFHSTYLWHKRDIVIILMRRTTDITDGKQSFAKTVTEPDRAGCVRFYGSLSATDGERVFFNMRTNAAYKGRTLSWSLQKCLRPWDYSEICHFFL